DIVPRWQQMHVELYFARTFQGLCRNPLGAPGDVLKQRAMEGLQSEQVIASVRAGAENGALSRLRQHAGGFDQKRSRQCRTVGIEDDRCGMSERKYFFDRLYQTFAESGQARIDQSDVRR